MFETQRLRIRPWRLDDAAAFLELSQDRGLTDNTITLYEQKTIQDAEDWIKNNPSKWAVWEKDSDKIIGLAGITSIPFEGEILPDVTYRIRESHWGQGLGRELAQGIINFGLKSLGHGDLTITITPDNEGSKKIGLSLGFVFEKRILLYGVETDLYRLRKSS